MQPPLPVGTDPMAILAALDRSQAIIEFALDGTILTANRNFLDAVDYTLDELRGRPHTMFLPPGEKPRSENNTLWDCLRRGQFQSGEYRHIARCGREVWFKASYNPVVGRDGRPLKILVLATDITAAKQRTMADRSKIEAIYNSQAIIEFALDGTILTANANFLETVGYRLDEIAGGHHSLFLAPEDRDTAAYRAFWDALREGKCRTAQYRRIGKGGRIVWIRASYNPVFDGNGKPMKVLKFVSDITAEVARQEEVRLLSLVADATSNSAVITDAEGRIEYVNAGFTRMTGYSFEEVRGRKPGTVLQGPATSQATRDGIRQKLSSGLPFVGEIVNYTRDGAPYWISLSINPVPGEDGRICRFVAIQSNVTERKAAEAQIAFMAHHDALTGLGNRTLFHERLSEALQQRRLIALLCLDLDRFKLVNDTLGHAGGDELLRAVSARLLESVRPSDTVARLGGDEFAVICDGYDTVGAVQATAQRIIKRIEAPFEIETHQVGVGVSTGIAVAAVPNVTPRLLLQQADQALYGAKHAGRGVYRQFQPALAAESAEAALV